LRTRFPKTIAVDRHMTSPAQEPTVHLQLVRDEPRKAPFQPPRYSFDFADTPDASRIAALGAQYALDAVRQSLAKGNDEWIIARRGEDMVAAVRIRAEQQPPVYAVDAPVVDAQHLHCGLERYLTHLAELWIQSLTLPISA
jgi:hypothetical protein